MAFVRVKQIESASYHVGVPFSGILHGEKHGLPSPASSSHSMGKGHDPIKTWSSVSMTPEICNKGQVSNNSSDPYSQDKSISVLCDGNAGRD